jgi:hypothetical protein
MVTHSRTAEREEESRLNMRTLVIASAASAAAALITSRLWIAGTWIAAAMTPVIVTLVSELLHRPTERIARTLTTDRAALPAAGGAAPPARPDADPLPDRVPEEPGAGAGRAQPPAPAPGSDAPVRVYRSGAAGPHATLPGEGGRRRRPATRRRRIAYRAVFGTAALAFVIAVAVITVPELVAGGSVGKGDGRTTFFSSSRQSNDRDREQQAPQDTSEEQRQQPEEPQRQPLTEEETTPAPEEEEPPPAEETTPEATPRGEPLETTPVPPTQEP